MPEKILKAWLSRLDIRISAALLTQQIKSHPDYPSLLSITDTLDHFGITNTAVQLEKEVLPEIDTPFLAHLRGKEDGFVICNNGESPEKKYPAFFGQWSGVIVIAEKNEGWEHRLNSKALKKEEQGNLIRLLCTGAVAAVAAAAAWMGSGWVLTSLLMLALAGIFVSWMIVSKDLGIENKAADQVCGKEHECKEVLHSKGAKLLFGVGLSDVSLLWFTSLFLSLCTAAFAGSVVPMIGLVSVFTLLSVPVIFYSLFYQWPVAGKWCRLCLLTAGLLMLQLIVVLPGVMESGLQFPGIRSGLLFATILLGTGLAWFPFKSLYREREKLAEEAYQGTRFKHNETVVKALLETRRHLIITPFENDLQLGNRLAPVQIMVACNPYCGPCAGKHKMLHEILENNEEKIGLTVRFVVRADEPDNKVSRAVAHIFTHIRQHTRDMKDGPRALYTRQVLHDWFLLADFEKFSEKYPAREDTAVINVLRQQEQWAKDAGIQYTPTIFLNGYELPFQYSVNDIPGLLPAVQGMLQQQDERSREEEFA